MIPFARKFARRSGETPTLLSRLDEEGVSSERVRERSVISSPLPVANPTPRRTTGPSHRPGTYISCTACGRLLRIEWATRSIVCACGARITPQK
jgi:hypothetical protein